MKLIPKHKFGNKILKYFGGGKPNSNRDYYLKSLDNWISKNPVYKGIETKRFRNFFDLLVFLESSYNSDAQGGSPKPGWRYRGWYQTPANAKRTEDVQHAAAFDHLIDIFKNQLTDADLKQAKSKGITAALLLGKYWNLGNRVTAWLYGNSDDPIGKNPKISEYGNTIVDDALDYSEYLGKAITDDYIILNKGQSIGTFAPRVRNSSLNSSRDRAGRILEFNKNNRTTHIGDTIWLVPRKEPTIRKSSEYPLPNGLRIGK